MLKEKILYEITNFCKECPSSSCCCEEECVLFRIEKLIINDGGKKDNEIDDKRIGRKI